MLLPMIASAVLNAATPSPPRPPAGAPANTPSIDSLLQPPGDGSTDTDEEPGAPPPQQGPIPYGEIDGKAYDQALKGAAGASRAAAGPLDGGWILASADGHRMYRFQFLDHGYGFSQAEGAWRDLDGGRRLQGSGFVDQIAYASDRLVLRFHEAGSGDEVLVTVKPAGAGTWSGQLLRGGAFTQVFLRRD